MGREDVMSAEYAENRLFPVEKFGIHSPNRTKTGFYADSGLPAISKKNVDRNVWACNDHRFQELAQLRRWRYTAGFQRLRNLDSVHRPQSGANSLARMGRARHRGLRVRVGDLPRRLPLSENNTLTESFPGVFDHFKSFIVGGLFYAIGSFLLAIEASSLAAPEQILTLAVALIVGGALTLVAVLVAVAAALVRPKK
jgi:hypothetical protein